MDQSKVNLERIRACDAGWDENKHPRADNGQFTSGGGGGALRPMAAGSKAVNRATEGKRLSHNAKVYIQTAHKAMESHNKKIAPEIESQQKKVQHAHSQLNNHYLNLSNRIRREYERAPEYERRNVSNKYGKLVDKVNEKYGGILHKEKEKLRDIDERERRYLAEKIASQESRLVRARKYNSRTKKLQDLAKALHQKHPELARKAEAAKGYSRQVASKQKELEGMGAFIKNRNLGTHYRNDAKARINAARESMEMDRPVANKYPDLYKADRNNLLNAHADLEAHIRAANAKKNR